ncbi:hypothetical protein [Pectobacterium brasiliense]|uniref:hypothetical protein n=1 Tax=Pectobacterium brasiliense TaxID=180957 RepID=UPI00057C9270|nr:hypothetical protein [Pectobacterium brasiliense]KHT18290.1 hypothetical protein RC97_11775 [Pectobacterium brasiliense]
MKYFKCIIAALLTPISILALGVVYNSFKLNQFEWGNVSDWVSALSALGTLGVAYAAYRKAPDWLNQSMLDQTKEFMKVMNHVNSELCNLVLNNYDTDEEIIQIMAIPKFFPADEQIKTIKFLIPKNKVNELDSEYNKFKENMVRSYIEARDYSQVEEHEYKTYPDFYQYIASLKLVK